MRPTVALILIVVVVTIVALAYASPVDQTWVGGIYDDADYDDVIELLTDNGLRRQPPLQVFSSYAFSRVSAPLQFCSMTPCAPSRLGLLA